MGYTTTTTISEKLSKLAHEIYYYDKLKQLENDIFEAKNETLKHMIEVMQSKIDDRTDRISSLKKAFPNVRQLEVVNAERLIAMQALTYEDKIQLHIFSNDFRKESLYINENADMCLKAFSIESKETLLEKEHARLNAIQQKNHEQSIEIQKQVQAEKFATSVVFTLNKKIKDFNNIKEQVCLTNNPKLKTELAAICKELEDIAKQINSKKGTITKDEVIKAIKRICETAEKCANDPVIEKYPTFKNFFSNLKETFKMIANMFSKNEQFLSTPKKAVRGLNKELREINSQKPTEFTIRKK